MWTELILQAVISGLLMGLIYALVAVGLSLIFGLMEIVNFAHGEFLMLAMFTAFWFWALAGPRPAAVAAIGGNHPRPCGHIGRTSASSAGC